MLHFLPSEVSHHIALKGLKIFYATGLLKLFIKPKKQIVRNSLNLDLRKLSNKVGIAAGLDKNGDYIDCLGALGIGFLELGTVTPRPQIGNPKPRLFRNRKDKSLINRLGFNNKGVDHLVKNLKYRKSDVIIGSSIGKNYDTPNQIAYRDYLICLEKIYQYSDYIAVNVSSPNTKGLRDLTDSSYLNILIKKLKNKQSELAIEHGYKPIFIKLSPDEELSNLKEICISILDNKLDGIICCNTTIEHSNTNESGGLSGAPLREKATSTLKVVKSLIGDQLPIIASGGVMSALDYEEKIEAGADLVQIYTGFIYEGPKLIEDIVNLSSV